MARLVRASTYRCAPARPAAGWRRRALATVSWLGTVALGTALAGAVPGSAAAGWWEDNFEVHGFARSTVYFNSPSLDIGEEFQMSSWRNELNLETTLDLYAGDELQISMYGVFRPVYDAVWDVYPHTYGKRREGAAFGSQFRAPNGFNTPALTIAAREGDTGNVPGHGACIEGQSCDINQDTGFVFTGKLNPQLIIDPTIFFGVLGGATRTRGSDQPKLGGQASLQDYEVARAIQASLGATPATSSLLGSFATAAAAGRNARTPLRSPSGAPPFGDRHSLKQIPADINRTQGQLATDCFDNSHPWCFVRELYFDIEYKNLFLRIGKQQIVWGKTDAFRLQDIINPMDLGQHNIFPGLEDRRIPQLGVDLIYSFGDVGPLQDLSLELAWIFDRFMPVQVGQCGEAYAFTAACEARADVGGHGLLNVSLAGAQERDWQLENSEPGFRVEFRIPEPSIAFSISGFWGFQDAGVARFKNHYSTTNPNPAMLLFLQGLGVPEALAAAGLGAVLGPFLTGFDPYDASGGPTSVQAASTGALTAWSILFGAGGVLCDSAALAPQAHANCISASGVQVLGWPWATSQAIIQYPRTFTLGASLDYQIPGVDTILRLEAAWDFDRKINNTREFDGVDESDVFLAAIGLDRSFFIPFLNRNRTAFVSFQTFVEHVVDFDGGKSDGMTVHETSVISTFFMQNYWRNDSLILTNFFAYDFSAQAWATGPSFKWIINDRVSLEVGANLLQGRSHKHNIRNICADGSVSCIGDPTAWQAGNWQLINENFRRKAEAPFWNLESFADTVQEDRDEVWFAVTYQF